MVTETDRNKARSAVVSAYHALDCVTIPFSFLHAFADAAVDAVSTDAAPVTMDDEDRTPMPAGFDDALWQKADEVHHDMALVARDQECVKIIYDALSTHNAEPVKTPFEIASKHIPEARVSLLSRAIRQGLNDYGWKNFGTLPEMLMGYIVEAERAEAAAHAEPVKNAPAVAVKALEWEVHGEGWRGCGSIIYDVYPAVEGEGWWSALSMAGYLPFRERCKSPEAAKAAAQSDYEARIRSALSAQVQDVAGIRAQAIEDVLSALTAHELYQYRPKAFRGFIDYARSTLINDEDGKLWRANASPASKHGDAE